MSEMVFTRFRSKDFLFRAHHTSGRPVEIDCDKMNVLIDANLYYTT